MKTSQKPEGKMEKTPKKVPLRPEKNTDTLLLLSLATLTLFTGVLLFSSDSVFFRRYFHFDSRLAGVFFTSTIPGFQQVITESDPDLVLEQRKLDLFLYFLVGIRHPTPQELFRVQLPVTTFYQQKKNLVPVSGAGVSRDRKSTRLNSSHVRISYAVFCLKKKKTVADTWMTSSPSA